MRIGIRSAAVLVLASVLGAGCGDSKGGRVSGKVTFNGKPVPAGKIYFIPDAAKGNTGQAGFADIKDGQYDTASSGGQGVKPGAMKVAIEGSDPASKETDKKSGEVTTKALFPRWETTAEVPAGGGTLDFEVPASAAQPKKAVPQP
jgi:hypothetical protein